MGCGASKEAGVTTTAPAAATAAAKAKVTAPAPAPAPAIKQQQLIPIQPSKALITNKPESAASALNVSKPPQQQQQNNNNNNNNNDEQKTPMSAASDTNDYSRNSQAIMLATLNDAVPGSSKDSNEGGGRGRDRFLSYASGASTPNTSSGNLSWDGNKSDNKNNNHDDATMNIKGGEKGSLTIVKNAKLLKHSSSAIGLDELHTDGAGLTAKVVHIEVPFGKPIEEVYDGVHNGPVLGSGVSGLVRLVTHTATGVQYAVKCLDLGLVGTKEGLAQLREEIFIMCQLDHPNIVRLEEVYESHSEIYLVQELCVGGELFDRLDEQPDYHYTEAECARLVKQMLSAVRYLHSKGIIHRDLKLENFLFSSKAQDSELKMIDFGLSKHFRFGEVHHEAVGTPYTVAPEVIRGSYDERCDIWAIGVITFLLLSGDPPFGGCGGPEPLLAVRANILSGKFSFEPEDIWCLVSSNAKDFVKSLLVIDPQSRPTAREAQKNSWLREWASRASNKNGKCLNPNVIKALVNFKEYSDMRKLLSEVLSFTLLPDQIKELRKEFEKMDTDGSGEISLAALKQVLMTNAGAGSLGAMTEEEVEDIFNAMRVNKAETRIHWHEFIAAGLSQCQVDDRNLRLAFDRLDSDHKGYINLDDIMNLAVSDELHSEEQIRGMWRESMKAVSCTQAHITYDNFILLMKGQTKEPEAVPELLSTPSVRMNNLLAVPEGVQVGGDEAEVNAQNETSRSELSPTLSMHLSGDSAHFLEKTNEDEASLQSLPNMGVQAMYESSNSSIGLASPSQDSPSARKNISDIPVTDSTKIPEVGTKSSIITRRRSKSLEDENEREDPEEESSDSLKPAFRGDTRRAFAPPEHDAQMNNELAKNKIALAVNRQLYRAHRQMRLSVLEASRRFEEQQARRARDTLIAQNEEEGLMGAGLVMRHGHKVQVTSESIRKYLEEYRAEQQQLVEKANRRGGRGRSTRKKTISDMSAMMNPSMGQDELGDIAIQAATTPDVSKKVFSQFNSSLNHLEMPTLPAIKDTQQPPKSINMAAIEGLAPSVAVIDKSLRKGTVPGEFRKTQDPFSSEGMYGGARISAVDVNQISASDFTSPIRTSDNK